MQQVRAKLDTNFIVVTDADFSNRGTQITVSRCQPDFGRGGFVLWIDFTIPYDGNTAVGTVEAFLTTRGNLTAENMSGNLYSPPVTSNNV